MNEIKIKVYGDKDGRIDTPSKYVNDLVEQIGSDIYPLFFYTSGKAPFTVLRNLFCFVDHISRLKFGNKMDSLEKVFKSLEFGTYVKIRQNYRDLAPFLIQMYRHELIHHVRPFNKLAKYKIKKGNGTIRKEGIQEIGFYISSGINKKLKEIDLPTFQNVTQFMKTDINRKNFCHLRSTRTYDAYVVNTLCFMGDVVDYLERYKDVLLESMNEQVTFVDNYNIICNDNLHRPNDWLVLDNYHMTNATGSDTDLSPKDIDGWYKTARQALFGIQFEK